MKTNSVHNMLALGRRAALLSCSWIPKVFLPNREGCCATCRRVCSKAAAEYVEFITSVKSGLELEPTLWRSISIGTRTWERFYLTVTCALSLVCYISMPGFCAFSDTTTATATFLSPLDHLLLLVASRRTDQPNPILPRKFLHFVVFFFCFFSFFHSSSRC